MYFALNVGTGFQCENGCAAREAGGGGRGEGGGLLIRRVKGCVKNIEIVFFMKTFSSWILKVVDLGKNNAKT